MKTREYWQQLETADDIARLVSRLMDDEGDIREAKRTAAAALEAVSHGRYVDGYTRACLDAIRNITLEQAE